MCGGMGHHRSAVLERSRSTDQNAGRQRASGRPDEPSRTEPPVAAAGGRRRRVPRALVLTLALILVVGALVASGGATEVLATGLVGTAKVRAAGSGLEPLEVGQLPERTTVLDAKGNVLARMYVENRVTVSLSQVPKVMVDAILAAEDRRFYDHDGVDPNGVLRAATANVLGDRREGASTITQQYVKNILQAQARTKEQQAAAAAPTLSRKLDELFYANDLERRLTKDQILEGYLNTVYFGEQAWGIGAAASHYFSKTVDQLTIPEAALLAGLVQSPSAYAPSTNPDRAVARRNEVLRAMRDDRRIDDVRYQDAVAQPLALQPSTTTSGCVASSAPFFCDWVRQQLEDDPALGTTRDERVSLLTEGGLTVTTTLDPDAQAAAQAAVDAPLGRADRVAVASVTVEPGTGRVLAMAVSRDYGNDGEGGATMVNLATSPSPTGSTFKAFTLAAALEQGISPDTVLPGGASYRSKLDNPDSGAFTNFESEALSNLSLRSATEHSVNTAYVQLEERVGVRAVADMARRLGITLPTEGPGAVTDREASLTLGAREVSPLDMASAYATFAAGGMRCPATGVASIVDRSGRSLETAPPCEPVLDPAVASTVTDVLKGVVRSGTGTAAAVPGQDIAGKTGTTQDHGAAWFVGYTNRMATAVWVGDPRGPSYVLRNVAGIRNVTGGSIPAKVFSDAMRGELATPPPPATEGSQPLTVMPDVVGLPADLARTRLAGLGVQVDGITDGTVTSTVPAAGQPLRVVRITLVGGQP